MVALALASSMLVSVQPAAAADLYLTGPWSPSTSVAGDVTVTISGPGLVADNMGSVAAFSNPAVNGAPAAQISLPGAASAFTLTFSRPVTNPILHIDRLGGWAGGGTNGALLTITSGQTVQRLSGVGHFLASGNTISQTVVTQPTITTGECSTNRAVGTACGSVRIVGTNFTSLNFSTTPQGSPGGDVIEFAVEVPDLDPIAGNDTGTTSENGATVVIPWAANDSFPDGTTLSSVDATSVGGGTVVNNGNNTFSYTPAPNFSGIDTFTYRLCDNDSPTPSCAVGTVTITVTDTGNPVANDDSGLVAYGTPAIVNWIGNDTIVDEAVLTSFDATTPNGGTVTNNGNGTFTYVPAVNFSGTDTFNYTICDDDNPPSCDSAVVTMTVPLAPAIGVAKAVSSVTGNGDGTFNVTYGFVIENLGNEPLQSLQLTDDLASSFPAGYSVIALTSPTLTTNASFDGNSNKNLLSGVNVLAFSATATMTLVVRFTPASTATINNQASATATGSSTLTPAADLSDDGTEPDANGNYIASDAGEDDPTPLTPAGIPLAPAIDAAKTLSSFVDNGNGTFTATYGIAIANTGNETLTGVQIADNLAATFPAGFAVDSLTSLDLSVNGSFDGSGDTNLLDGSDSFAFGESGSLVLVVTFTPATAVSVDNQATATGTGIASSAVATDSSTVGTGAIGVVPSIATAKAFDGFVSNGDGTFTASYTVTVANDGNESLTSLQITDDLASNYPTGYSVSNITSATLVVNGSFNGDSDQNLLAATDTLAVGTQASVSFDVIFLPTGTASIDNQATGAGIGVASTTSISAVSTVGTDPTNPANPVGPTPTGPLVVTPSAAAAKALVGLIDNGDGTFTASYSVTIANDGGELLNAVQITDDLATNFPAGYSVANLTSATLTINPSYNGNGSQNLLTGVDTLAVSAQASVAFDVTFTPASAASIDNQATVAGTGNVSGSATSAPSTVGTDPTDPGNAVGPTPTGPLAVVPSTLAAKALDSLADNGDGTFTASYTVSVANDGNEILNSVQITDDLAANFPAGYSVTNITSATLTVNPAFDGGIDKNLLTAADSLAVGAQRSVSFDVNFTPLSTSSIDNQATSSGVGNASGTSTSAASTVGTDPTDPGNTVGPTPTGPIVVTPVIGGAKALVSLTDNGDGSFTAALRFTVENFGTELLSGVQISDDLATGFPAGYVIDSLSSPTLAVNASFDGDGDQNVLAGTDSLAVGTTATVDLIVTVVPISASFTNQALVAGTGAVSGDPTTDLTDAGFDPDGNGNGDPTEATENDPTPVIPPYATYILAAKAVDSFVDNGDGTFTTSYTVTIANDGNEILNSVQITDNLASNYPAGYTVANITSPTLLVNLSFDGGTNQNLLTGVNTLAVNAQASVSFDVTFTPSSGSSIDNQAVATAVGSASGVTSSAPSTVGTDPTDPTNPVGPTPTGPINVVPSVDASKALDGIVNNGDGTFTATYTVTATNSGNEPLASVQITDDLASVFPAGFSVANVATVGLTANGGFDGAGDPSLLAGSDGLGVGADGSISFDVIFTPTSTASITNTADVTASGATSTAPTSASSSVGTGPISVAPSTKAAKAVTSFVDNADGTFTTSYSISMVNDGNEALDSVQITDDLVTGYPAGYTVTNLTSPTLTINSSFDGNTNQNLLVGTDSLAVGVTATVTFDVIFVPASTSAIDNQAQASGVGRASGTSTSALTTVGADPSEPTNPTGPTPTPAIPLVPSSTTNKVLDSLADNGDGTFTANYTVSVTNTGNEALSSLQIADDLASNYPPGYVVANLASATLTVDPAFDGNANTNLLGGTDSLAFGASGSVSFNVTFAPASTASIDNTAASAGNGAASGTAAPSSSTIGTGAIVVAPSIAAAKAVNTFVDNGNGTFTTSYSVAIANDGNETLSSVQITDDLVSNYPAGYVVGNLASADLSVNASFDGDADQNLLDGTDSLAVGTGGSVTFDVTFTPTSTNPVLNQATASGTGNVSSASTSADTTIGTDPTDPGNTAGPTPTPNIPVAPSVQAAKAFDGLVDNGDGTFTTSYSISFANSGNEALTAIQITDDLASNYPAGYTVSNLTSATLTVNSSFDGDTNQAVLTAVDSLTVGGQATVSFDVTFTPTSTSSINNQANVSGVGAASGTTASAPTTVGTDPTDPLNPAGPTPTGPLSIIPSIDAAKSVDPLVDNGDGTFTAQYSIIVTNDGSEVLDNLQATDDLAANFPAGFTVSGLASATLTVNPTFNGGTDLDLLAGSDSLAVGDSGTITFAVLFTPANGSSISNEVVASGAGSVSGTPATDASTVGTGTISVVPSALAAKALDALVDNGDGTFTASYTVAVANNGNEILNAVQITDDLASNFPSGYSVANIVSGTLVVNPAFDGNTNQNLLAGTDSLALGAQASVSFDVTFTPVSTSSIDNEAVVSGVGNASGANTSATSTVGTDPTDPGNPVGPTPTGPIVVTPVIGAAKFVPTVTDNGDGSFTALIRFTVENFGTETLNSVQLSDDLVTRFPAGYVVDAITSPTLTVNASFDGDGDQLLLAGTDSLAVGATTTVDLTVTMVPTAASIINQAIASGTGAVSGNPTTDLSDAGLDPDSNGNGNPDEPTENEPTPVIPNLNPQIPSAKSVDSLVDNADGTFTTSYTVTIVNDGNELLNSVQITDDLASNYPAGYTIANLSSPTLTVDLSFDGNTNQNLLAGTDSLTIGTQGSVTFDVTFVPASSASIDNQAVSSAVGDASGVTATALSTIGTDPADPANLPGPTPTGPINVVAAVGVTKTVSSLTDNGNGTFTTSYSVIVSNGGNEQLNSVQVTDNLASNYPAGYTVANVTSATLAVNGAFNGGADQNLLLGTDTLGVGANGSVSFDVTFTPTSAASMANTADASATGATSGAPTTATSSVGTGPLSVVPSTGAAKAVTAFIDNGDGTFTTSYSITMVNDGNEAIDSVQITDDLVTGYPAGFVISNLASPTLSINSGFDGNADQNLLTGADSLLVGATATVTLDVTFVPVSTSAIDNQAFASGVGRASGASTSAPTTVGTDPSEPTNPAGPTPTPTIPLVPGTTTDKVLDGLADNGNGTFTAGYTISISNTGNEALSSVQIADDLTANFPAGFVVSNLGSATLTVDPLFDGVSVDTLLIGTDPLAFGASGSVSFDVTFTPTSTASIDNEATTSATGTSSGASASSASSIPTGVVPVAPSIAAAKAVDSFIDNGNGTFTTSYIVAIENNGNESLSSLQITDDLATNYPAGYVVGNLASADLSVNASFDGNADQNLLDGTDSLAVGAGGSVTFDVTFTPTATSPIDNQAVASGLGDVTTTTATTPTTVGTNPTNSDNPTGPTPTPTIPVVPSAKAAKAVTGFGDNGDGTFTTSYRIAVENDGNESLNSVQIADDLASNYPAGYTVSSLFSATLTVNPGFDGGGDQLLLSGGDSLAVGGDGILVFDVTFVPASLNSVDNQAEVSGVGAASGTTATALSTVGTDPTNPTNPSGPTPTGGIGVVPSASASKSVAPIADNGDGTFTTTYTVFIANGGNEALLGVQISDNLATNYPAGYVVSSISSATLTVNPLFDGDTVSDLLAGVDALNVGAQASVSFGVTFLPTSTASIDNEATFTGTGAASGSSVSAATTVGSDPTDSSNPIGPTPSGPIPVAPASAAAKSVAPVVDNGDGTFTASYTVTISNDGNELLQSVQIADDLASNFASGYSVANLASPTLTVNAGFDGDADQDLLSGADTLAIGAQAAVTFDVVFVPVSLAPVPNQATVNAVGTVTGSSTSAVSTVGVDPTDPSNPTGPTFTTAPPVAPSGAAAKAVDSLVDNGDGTFTTGYTVRVANNGNETLSGVQITDDLATNYPAGFVVSNLSSATLTINSGFDGDSDRNLLDGSDSLAVGASAAVTFDVSFVPASASAINNQAVLDGTGVVTGSDISVPTTLGADPLDPTNPVGPTPTPAIPVTPSIGAAKSVSAPANNGDGTFTVSYDIAMANTGNEVLDSFQITDDLVSNFPAGYVVTNLASSLTANTGFDGNGDQTLLSGTDSLSVGATANVSFDVTFVPISTDPIPNQATASGTGRASATPASTPTSVGTDPTDPTNPVGPTMTGPIVTNPSGAAAKSLNGLVDNLDGTFTSSYIITIANEGDEALELVQITDDLATNYPAGYVVTNLSSPTLNVNAAFDGGGTQSLLTGADTLAIGQQGVVGFDVTFVPTSTDSIDNQAVLNATGFASNATISVPTTVGTDPLDATNPVGPTPTGPVEPRSALGVAKNLDSLVDNGDGTFAASFTFTIENLGSELINGVQLSDALVDQFTGGYSIGSLTSPTLGVNTGFNGDSDQDMLTGTDDVAPGSTHTVGLLVTFTPDSALVLNQAIVSGTGATTGDTLTDMSDDGLDPDPDGDGNPGGVGEGDPTSVVPALSPTIGVAKAYSSTTDHGDGTFSVRYALTVTGYANENLDGVQVIEDFTTNFPAGFTIDELSSDIFSVNSGFNGNSDTDLLDGSDALAVGQTGSIIVSVRFTPTSVDPIANTVVARGTGTISGTTTADTSVDGFNPDPDSNGSPVESSDTMSPPLTVAASGAAAKSVDSIVDNGDGTLTVTYTIALANTGTEGLESLQISDDLATNYPIGYVVSGLASSDFAVNAGFNGGTDANLLDGTDTFAVGATGSLSFAVSFVPVSNASIDNIANGAGTGELSGTPTTFVSTVGTDPTDPTNVAGPTPTGPFTLVATTTTTKAVGSLVDNGDGSFTTNYVITVRNTGNERLDAVQVTDDVVSNYPVGFAISGLRSTTFAVNGSFDGAGNQNLLAGTTSLAVGQSGQIRYAVRFVPVSVDPISNTANSTATGAASGGGAPSTSTVLTGSIPLRTEAAVAKAIEGAIADNGDGSFTTTFRFTLENLGNEAVNSVQISDDLTAFGADVTVESISSSDFVVNGAFDGLSDVNMLAGTDTLAVGDRGAVRMTLTWTPLVSTTQNQAIATSTGVTSGTSSTDESTDGLDPDPDGDGTGDEAVPTDVVPPFEVAIAGAKAVDGYTVNNNGSITIRYTISLRNDSNQPLANVQVVDDGSQLGELLGAEVVATSDNLTANPSFVYGTSVELLSGTDELARGETGWVTVEFTVYAKTRILQNIAQVLGSGLFNGVSASAATTVGTVPGAGEEGPTTTEIEGSSISGVVWEDLDLDGIQDPNEPLLSGVAVILLPVHGGEWDAAWPVGADGKPIVPPSRTALTDENGRYYFGPLPDGTYRVEVVPSDGRSVTPKVNRGSDDSVDSDFDKATNKTAVLTIIDGSPQCASRYVCDLANVSVGLTGKGTGSGVSGSGTSGGGTTTGVSSNGRTTTLAFTGSTTRLIIGLGIALMAIGWFLMVSTRRREEDDDELLVI